MKKFETKTSIKEFVNFKFKKKKTNNLIVFLKRSFDAFKYKNLN